MSMDISKPIQVPAIEIRQAASIAEMEACVNLQQWVWQYPDKDVIPRRMFVVARSVGGQVLGAWAGDKLAGYALAIPGIRKGRHYLHSHMLAVMPEYRNRGIGVKLKLAQRDDALARGIDLIEWTFDPLQTKNAFLNIEKLGAIARRYSVNFYGESTSPLHARLPTDRLHAEWWVGSERVRRVVEGNGLPDIPTIETIAVTEPEPHAGGTLQAASTAALESLLRLRQQFSSAFARQLAVLRFENTRSGHAQYLLGAYEGGIELTDRRGLS